MTNSVTITSSWQNGSANLPLTELQKAIQARAKILGETSEKACVATAINALKTMRAETGTVKSKNFSVFGGNWIVRIEESDLKPGWAHPGKNSPRGRRVVRPAGGGTAMDRFNGGRIVNLAGGYLYAGGVQAFKLSITNTESQPRRPFYPAHGDFYIVLARSRADVEKFAENRIRRRIGQYRGVSKRALGLAMHKLSESAAGGSVSADVERIVGRLVSAKTYGSGYNSGEFGVSVADDLPRAVLALKHGQAGLDLAVMKAANMTSGIINRVVDKGFGERFETPFPHIQKVRK